MAFEHPVLNNTIGEYISNKGLTQLRIAETEKYAHVTGSNASERRKKCEAISGCVYKQMTCAGAHWVYSCPSGWTLSGKFCVKNVSSSGSCSPGNASSYTYGWVSGFAGNGLPTCNSGGSRPSCSSGLNGSTYTTSCTCQSYKYGTGSVCGCAKYNCTD